MKVRVLYFGVLKESLGRDDEMVELADGARVADVMARFENEEWMRSIAVAVNREYARRDDALRDGDEVALLPPVSGGAGRHTPGAKAPCGSEREERAKPEGLAYLEACIAKVRATAGPFDKLRAGSSTSSLANARVSSLRMTLAWSEVDE